MLPRLPGGSRRHRQQALELVDVDARCRAKPFGAELDRFCASGGRVGNIKLAGQYIASLAASLLACGTNQVPACGGSHLAALSLGRCLVPVEEKVVTDRLLRSWLLAVGGPGLTATATPSQRLLEAPIRTRQLADQQRCFVGLARQDSGQGEPLCQPATPRVWWACGWCANRCRGGCG